MLLALSVIFLSPFLTLTQFNCCADAAMLIPNCSFVDTYETGTTFESNLLHLLSSLSTNALINGAFYSDSFGNSPNTVYGLIMCFADSPLEDCIDCLQHSTSDATLTCSGSKTATVLYDSCVLSYSSKDFLSVADPYDPDFSLDGDIWDDEDSKNTVMQELENLSAKAPYASELFSFSNEVVRRGTNVSVLVQCTKDLSPTECGNCISYTMPYVYLYSLNYSFSGVRIIARNCYVRYSSDSFTVSSFPKSLVPSPNDPQSPPMPPRSPPTVKSSSGGSTVTIVVSIIAVVLVVAVLAASGFYFWRTKQSLDNNSNGDNMIHVHQNIETDLQHILNPNAEYQVFDFNTLKIATENFSDKNRLGGGGFGPVYKGILPDSRQVIAVKRLSETSVQGTTEFKNEVELLVKLKHKNLVRLLGCCIANQEKLLCYEFLPNGSLDKTLFAKDASRRAVLSWKMRHKIIEGITHGLHYLHEESQLTIVHRDLKVSNILLDKDMNPKISDFGLARFFEEGQTHKDTRHLAGTFGYMAPEYIWYGNYSAKSDVYSFGVLLLEILTGQDNSSFAGSNHMSNLINHALMHWKNGTVSELMDPMLDEAFYEEIKRCVYIALLCVQENPTDRPNMETVRNMLASPSMKIPSLPLTWSPTSPTYDQVGDSSMTTDASTITQSVHSQAESFGSKAGNR